MLSNWDQKEVEPIRKKVGKKAKNACKQKKILLKIDRKSKYGVIHGSIEQQMEEIVNHN